MNRLALIKQAAIKVQPKKLNNKVLNDELFCKSILQSEYKKVNLSNIDFKSLNFN